MSAGVGFGDRLIFVFVHFVNSHQKVCGFPDIIQLCELSDTQMEPEATVFAVIDKFLAVKTVNIISVRTYTTSQRCAF